MTGPIKILRVITSLRVGGATQQVANLSAGLKSRGFETILVAGRTDSCDGDMSDYCEKLGVPVRIVDGLSARADSRAKRRAFFDILKILWREKPHILHTHLPHAGYIARLAARILRPAGVRPRVFHTYHGHVVLDHQTAEENKRLLARERRAARWSHRLIAVSPRLRQELDYDHQIAVLEKIEAIMPGLDLAPFLEMPRHAGFFRKKIGVDEKAPLIGMIGRLHVEKNHIGFLDSFKEILKEIPTAVTVIVGEGEERDRLKSHVESIGVAGNVRWAKFTRDLKEIYSDLDLLVSTSKNEGAPTAVIEAQAAGCPVVATDACGTAEVLLERAQPKGHRPREERAPAIHAKILAEHLGGYVVKRMSAENFTRGCKDVILGGIFKLDPECRQLVARRFGVDRLCDDTAKLYRDVLTPSS